MAGVVRTVRMDRERGAHVFFEFVTDGGSLISIRLSPQIVDEAMALIDAARRDDVETDVASVMAEIGGM